MVSAADDPEVNGEQRKETPMSSSADAQLVVDDDETEMSIPESSKAAANTKNSLESSDKQGASEVASDEFPARPEKEMPTNNASAASKKRERKAVVHLNLSSPPPMRRAAKAASKSIEESSRPAAKTQPAAPKPTKKKKAKTAAVKKKAITKAKKPTEKTSKAKPKSKAVASKKSAGTKKGASNSKNPALKKSNSKKETAALAAAAATLPEDDATAANGLDLFTKQYREFERSLVRLEKIDQFGYFWDPAPEEFVEDYTEKAVETDDTTAVDDQTTSETDAITTEKVAQVGETDAEVVSSSSHPPATTIKETIYPSHPPFNWKMIRRRRDQGRYILDIDVLEAERRTNIQASLATKDISSKEEPPLPSSALPPSSSAGFLHTKTVQWDLFRKDVTGMCDSASKRNPDELGDGKTGSLLYAVNKIKGELDKIYERTARRHMNEVMVANGRHQFNAAIKQHSNMAAAFQGKWRQTPFPEREYEQLPTKNVVCAGLSELDERIATFELQTSLPDSFVGIAYKYEDNTGKSEAWMKSVLSETGGNGKKKAEETALALAKDEGVIRAQVTTSMEGLLIAVQDRVMTDAGVLHQSELRSANWEADNVMSASIEKKCPQESADSAAINDAIMSEAIPNPLDSKGGEPIHKPTNHFASAGDAGPLHDSAVGERVIASTNRDGAIMSDKSLCASTLGDLDSKQANGRTAEAAERLTDVSSEALKDVTMETMETSAISTPAEVKSEFAAADNTMAGSPHTSDQKVGDLDNGLSHDGIKAKAAESLPESTPDIVEQPVWGIDCYTRQNILICLSIEFDEKIALVFVEKWLLPAINACPIDLAHDIANAASILEGLPFMTISEETDDSGESEENKDLIAETEERWSHSLIGKSLMRKIRISGPPWLKLAAQLLRRARAAMGPDFFRIHPKGHGSIVLSPKLPPNTLVTFYRGEVYPSWRWGEKMDAIDITQARKKLKPNLPDFYNMALERPQKDPRKYGLLFVDASRKAGHGSSISHSCAPTCEVRVAALHGELCLAMTTLRPIEMGEELTFDYNAVTESLIEYRSAVCLCGNGKCRGSFLHFATADCYQRVLDRNAPIAVRFASLAKGCLKEIMSDEDERALQNHGFATAAFGAISVNRHNASGSEAGKALMDSMENVPVWLRTYVADTLRYIEYERRALPISLICEDLSTPKVDTPILDGATKDAPLPVDTKTKDDEAAVDEESEVEDEKPIKGWRPMPSFFFYSRVNKEEFRKLLKEEGFEEKDLPGLEYTRALKRVAAAQWKPLSDAEKLRWKKKAEKEWEKNGGPERALLEKKRKEGGSVDAKAKQKAKKARKSGPKKESLQSKLESSGISFQTADAEGVAAMEQRIQQLTQSLSRVGRVLDRHRETLHASKNETSVTSSDALRSQVLPPLTVAEDEAVVSWLWNDKGGLVRTLLSKIDMEECVSPSLKLAFSAITEKYKILDEFGTHASPPLEYPIKPHQARKKLTSALMEFRRVILKDLKAMAKDLKKQKLRKKADKKNRLKEEKRVKKKTKESFKMSTSVAPSKQVSTSLLVGNPDRPNSPNTDLDENDAMDMEAEMNVDERVDTNQQVELNKTSANMFTVMNVEAALEPSAPTPCLLSEESKAPAESGPVAVSAETVEIVTTKDAVSPDHRKVDCLPGVGIEEGTPALREDKSVAAVTKETALSPLATIDDPSMMEAKPVPSTPEPGPFCLSNNKDGPMQLDDATEESTQARSFECKEGSMQVYNDTKQSAPVIVVVVEAATDIAVHEMDTVIGDSAREGSTDIKEVSMEVDGVTEEAAQASPTVSEISTCTLNRAAPEIAAAPTAPSVEMHATAPSSAVSKVGQSLSTAGDKNDDAVADTTVDPQQTGETFVAEMLCELVDSAVAQAEGTGTDAIKVTSNIELDTAVQGAGIQPESATKKSTDEQDDDKPKPWLKHYGQRNKLQAAADILLMYARTGTFFLLQPYTPLKSTPIEVYAREIGNAVPRSVIDNAVSEKAKQDNPADDGIDDNGLSTQPVIALKGPVSKIKTSADKSRKKKEPVEEEELCQPDAIVAEVTISYRGDYVLSQLLQWYNGGIGQTPGLPDSLGCIRLPSLSGCWESQAVDTEGAKPKLSQPTSYETTTRPQLLNWFSNPHQRGSSWPEELRTAFGCKESVALPKDDPSLWLPLGSPVLDLLVTGDDFNIASILEEFGADDDSKKKTEKGLLDTVDEGRPAQAVSNWVQCELPNCGKWRKIPWHVDIDVLAKSFVCSNNKWNRGSNTCDAPEDGYEATDNDVVGPDGQLKAMSPAKKRPAVKRKNDGGNDTKKPVAKRKKKDLVKTPKIPKVPKRKLVEKKKEEPVVIDIPIPVDPEKLILGERFDVKRGKYCKYAVGKIMEIIEKDGVKVLKFHFAGRDAKYDELVEVGSSRICPLYSKVPKKIYKPRKPKPKVVGPGEAEGTTGGDSSAGVPVSAVSDDLSPVELARAVSLANANAGAESIDDTNTQQPSDLQVGLTHSMEKKPNGESLEGKMKKKVKKKKKKRKSSQADLSWAFGCAAPVEEGWYHNPGDPSSSNLPKTLDAEFTASNTLSPMVGPDSTSSAGAFKEASLSAAAVSVDVQSAIAGLASLGGFLPRKSQDTVAAQPTHMQSGMLNSGAPSTKGNNLAPVQAATQLSSPTRPSVMARELQERIRKQEAELLIVQQQHATHQQQQQHQHQQQQQHQHHQQHHQQQHHQHQQAAQQMSPLGTVSHNMYSTMGSPAQLQQEVQAALLQQQLQQEMQAAVLRGQSQHAYPHNNSPQQPQPPPPQQPQSYSDLSHFLNGQQRG